MPARFDGFGISFQYPDNWTLDDADVLLGHKSVTIYSPGGAFWSVTIHSPTAEPTEMVAAIVDTLRREYEGLEAEEAEENVAGYDLSGYDLAFYCLDLTNTAHVRGIRTSQATYMIYCQSEDREYELIKGVFQAVTFTLLGSLKDLLGS